MLLKILPYLRTYRWQVVWALAQVFLIAGFELLKPWPLQIVIDYVLGGKKSTTGGLVGTALSLPPGQLLLFACIGLVLVTIGSGGLTQLHYYTTIRVGQNMVNDLRGALFGHLQRQSLAYHGRQRVGDLMYRITADSFAVQTMIMNGVLPISIAGDDPARRNDLRPAADRPGADPPRATRGADPLRADIELQQEDR